MTSTSALPQLGHAIKSREFLSLSPKYSSNCLPLFASSIGSAVNEYLIVSPMPSFNSVEIPAVDFISPPGSGPASVTPKCKGYSTFSASNLYDSIINGTFECFTEIFILKKSTSSRYFNSVIADSTKASGVASPYFSSKSLSSDPPFTPIRIGMFALNAAFATSLICDSFLMFPGLSLRPSTPASIAASANLY